MRANVVGMERWSAVLAQALSMLAVVLFAVVVILNGWEAAARYFFAASSIYTVELSLVLASIVYFTGYAGLLQRDEDVRLEYFVKKLGPRMQRMIDTFNELASTLFFTTLVYGSWAYYSLTSAMPHVLFPFHQGYVVLPIAAGALACLWIAITRLLRSVLNLFDSD